MASWPRMERMIGTFGATVSRALLESFYATPSTEGLSVIFNRSVASVSALAYGSPCRGCPPVSYLIIGLSIVSLAVWISVMTRSCSGGHAGSRIMILSLAPCCLGVLPPEAHIVWLPHRTAMVEARVRRLPGYMPMPDHDDGMSEAGAFLWRLGDAFELWDEQGDALEEEEMRQECQPGVAPAGPPEVRTPLCLP